MAKIEYRTREKSVFLSHAETLLLLAAEFGADIIGAFLPRKYPETALTRRLLGLDTFRRDRVRVAAHRLIKQGLVAKDSHGSYRVTPRGAIAVGEVQTLIDGRRPKWDGAWRVVVFDVPERMRKHRDALRYALAEANFRRLQDSVWVGKQPLAGDVVELIEECGIGKYVYMFSSRTVDKGGELERLFRTS